MKLRLFSNSQLYPSFQSAKIRDNNMPSSQQAGAEPELPLDFSLSAQGTERDMEGLGLCPIVPSQCSSLCVKSGHRGRAPVSK